MGAPAVGQFALARKITELLNQLLIRPLARVAIPGFAAYAGRPDKLATLLERTSPRWARSWPARALRVSPSSPPT